MNLIEIYSGFMMYLSFVKVIIACLLRIHMLKIELVLILCTMNTSRVYLRSKITIRQLGH